MSTIYVSQHGNDANDGLSTAKPLATPEHALSVAKPGDTIRFKRGETWYPKVGLNITTPHLSFAAWGARAHPKPTFIADGDVGGAFVFRDVGSIADIIANGFVNGFYAVDHGIMSCHRTENYGCGTGIVAGSGGALSVIEDVICNSAKVAAFYNDQAGAGDGIQVDSTASPDCDATIRNAICNGNAWGGINIKAGIAHVYNAELMNNGETGYTAQNNCKEFHITGSLIAGNSAAEKGTPQVSIEDSAKVFSYWCVYKDPHNAPKDQWTMHVRLVGQPTMPYPQHPEFHSAHDVFISVRDQVLTRGAIGCDMNGFPATVNVVAGTFVGSPNTGYAIDCNGSELVSLTAIDCSFIGGTAYRLAGSVSRSGDLFLGARKQ